MMFALFTYLQIFAMPCLNVLLYLFPDIITYKVWVGFIGCVSFVLFCHELMFRKFDHKKTAVACIAWLLLILLYVSSKDYYPIVSYKYYSFLLVISLQITPIILCAVIVAQEKDTQERIKQFSPYFGIAFTIISFIAAFFPSGSINGGYLATDNGLNYQTNSYLAAYASACSYYYLLNFKTFQWRGLFRKKIVYNIVLASIVVNLLSIFVSGGRGGLVLFVCQTLMAIWFLIKDKNSYKIKSIHIFGGVCVIAGILIFAIHFAETSSLKTNGFERIVATVETGDSNGRDILREKALNAFEKSPIVGHGIGSVFNEIGEYSHNCITDSLVEGGLIGTIIYVLVIGVAFFKLYKRARLHNDEYIWLTFIVNGLILSLFSLYYLTQLPICWSTAFAYSLTAINNNKFRLNVRQHQL